MPLPQADFMKTPTAKRAVRSMSASAGAFALVPPTEKAFPIFPYLDMSPDIYTLGTNPM
jgi:hypothetical protein